MMKNLKIWQKFIVFLLIMFLILAAWNVLILIRTSTVNNAYQNVLNNVVLLNDANELMDEALEELELYLTTKSFRSTESFNRKFDELYRAINSMPIRFSTQEEQIAYSDLRGLLITLNQQVDQSISDIRGRRPLDAMTSFDEVHRISEQMQSTINYLVFKYMASSDAVYSFLRQETDDLFEQSLLVWCPMLLLSIVASYVFVKNITASISLLTEQSLRIAQYPEQAQRIVTGDNDEIGLLADAFNAMGDNIKRYIAELREKADVEKELRDTELKNLSMQNMLNAAELKALQSQINPHFLFNTLNSIAQMAMLEDAEETYDLIINVSGMLRYNLRRLDEPVRFREELENLNRYIFIQKTRYGDAIDFEIRIDDPSVYDLMMPCLSLQPIVENSIIHGFEGGEGKGVICLTVTTDQEFHRIDIKDNGVGMERETIERIMRVETSGKGHSTGIGICNVIYRLTLFFGMEVFSISSELGKGTCVTLKIPRKAVNQEKMGGETDGAINDRR